MSHLKKKGDWIQVTDKQTGLVGWVLSVEFTSQKPDESIGVDVTIIIGKDINSFEEITEFLANN